MNDHESLNMDEFRLLVGRLFDDCLEAGDVEKLRNALKSSVQCQEVYLDQIETHASLAWQSRGQLLMKASFSSDHVHDRNFVEPSSPTQLDSKIVSPKKRWSSAMLFGLTTIAASIVIALLVGKNFINENPVADQSVVKASQPVSAVAKATGQQRESSPVAPAKETNVKKTHVAVAKIGKSVAAIWSEGEKPSTPKSIGRGWLQLDSGTVRLDFFSGVRMVVQAPARVEVRSSWNVFLESGSISCDVGEHGKGFRVEAKGMNIVDLGTAFGMRVGPSGDPEVHVFSGKVAVVDDAGKATREIVENEAMQVSDGELRKMTYQAAGFTTVADVTRQANIEDRSRFAAWQKAANEISNDKATVVHYTMKNQQRDDLKVLNQAVAAPPPTDAMMIGCRLVEGRWRNKKAIAFQGNGDRLLLSVDEEQDSMTAIMWIQVDDRDQLLMSLLMSEEPSRRGRVNASVLGPPGENEQGEYDQAKIKLTRWGLWNSGALHLGQFRYGIQDLAKPKPNRDWDWFNTEPMPVLESSGQWSQVAVTYDGENREVKQFINGERVGRWDTTYSDSLRLGHLAIGNLSVDETELAQGVNREFVGSIDEVMISSRVYSQAEIRKCYEVGKP